MPDERNNATQEEGSARNGIGQLLVRMFSDPVFFFQRSIWTLFGIAGALGIIVVGAIWLIQILAPPLQVTVQSTGAVELSLPNNSRTSWYFISATGGLNSPWTDTGIRIPKRKDVSVHASGKATMAIHHIVNSANSIDNSPPYNPWVGPDGLDVAKILPKRSTRDIDDTRSRHLIYPHADQGCLLGFISDRQPSVREDPRQIIHIGSSANIEAKEHRGGTLWLAVNEVWLDTATLDSLAIHEPQNRGQYAALDSLDYYSAWFDDNSGGYLVVVEIK